MILHLFVLLFISTSIGGTHFQGGTISYKVVGNNGSGVIVRITQSYLYSYSRIYCNNTYIANQWPVSLTGYPDASATLTCVADCSTSGGYSPIPVTPRCTDYSSAMDITVGQRTDDVILQNGSYFRIAFASSAWRNLSLPTGVSTKTWSLSTVIDLRVRADGRWNTPPIATMISPIYIPVGVQQTISIPTIDADNDNVRCRFASGTNECGTVCPPASLPSGTTISNDCVLSITGANAGDWYAATIEVEDFADSTSTAPLSSVPVQFLIYVYDQPVCTRSPYLYSNIPTGSCVGVQVGVPYTLLLIVENYCSSYNVTMRDIATETFPIVMKSNIVQNTSTLWSVTLQWTPTADEIGSQIFCSVAVDSEDVQSNQYCLTFTVGNGTLGVCPGEVMTTEQLTSIVYSSTSSNISIENNTTTSGNSSSPTVIIVIVVPIFVVLISGCCCCCCCCYSRPKFTISPIKNEDQSAIHLERPTAELPTAMVIDPYRSSLSQGTSITGKTLSETSSSRKSWRKYPRWVYPVMLSDDASRGRFNSTAMNTTTTQLRDNLVSSRNTLPIKPRYIFNN